MLVIFSFINLFSLLSVITSSSPDKNSCTELSEKMIKKEEEIQQYIDDNIYKLKANSAACIDVLVKHGKFKALDFYLSELSKRNIKFKESLDMSINTLKKTLEDITNKYRFVETEYQSAFPAFQWAQSLKNVFLEIKFAHRHGSPGCLELKNLKVDIKPMEVSLVGYCVLGDVPIKYDFHIDLYRDLNVTNCTHEPGSVGTYRITLEKSKESYWRQLLRSGSVAPNNMKFWLEMGEKYSEELKKYKLADDEKAYEEELEHLGIKKKKKKKKSKRVVEKIDFGEPENVDKMNGREKKKKDL